MTTPVVYEVNIDVDPSISGKYVSWLKHHIELMRSQIEGLTEVTLCQRAPQVDGGKDNWLGFTVSYYISTRAALEDYLEHRAAAMRQDALDTFGQGKFVASRRIMNVLSLEVEK